MIKGSDKIRRDFTITKLTKSLRPLPSKTQENSPLSSFALNEEKAHKYVRNFINENTQKVSSRELTPKGKTRHYLHIHHLDHYHRKSSRKPQTEGSENLH